MSNLGNYIKAKRLQLGMNRGQMSDKLSCSSQLFGMYERGERNPKIDFYNKWKEVFNEDLFLFETNVSQDDGGGIQYSPPGRFPKKTKPGELIRFYDTDFAAGDIQFYDDLNQVAPAYTMDVPEFSGCTAFRTYGDSMDKLIRSGSILFGTKVEDWQSHLEFGQIYGIICTDNRKYLKYIRRAKSKDETHFLMKSENENYDDFYLPKEKIKHLWLIHGWINKRT